MKYEYFEEFLYFMIFLYQFFIATDLLSGYIIGLAFKNWKIENSFYSCNLQLGLKAKNFFR